MTKLTAAELLDLAIDRATKARNAGILRFSADAGGFSVELAPAEQPESDSGGEDGEEPELDVLDDPATFGRTKTVPGRNRKR